MFRAIDVLASSLSVARTRVNTLASNIANAETTRTEDGGPYKKLMVVQVAQPFTDVLDDVTLAKPMVKAVVQDEKQPRMVYEPGHPDANPEGYVAFPNINVVGEMTELMSATKAYEAAIAATTTLKQIEERGLNIVGLA